MLSPSPNPVTMGGNIMIQGPCALSPVTGERGTGWDLGQLITSGWPWSSPTPQSPSCDSWDGLSRTWGIFSDQCHQFTCFRTVSSHLDLETDTQRCQHSRKSSYIHISAPPIKHVTPLSQHTRHHPSDLSCDVCGCMCARLLCAARRAWCWPRKLHMICLKAALGGGVGVIR